MVSYLKELENERLKEKQSMQKIMNTLRKVTRGEDLKEKFSKIIEYL